MSKQALKTLIVGKLAGIGIVPEINGISDLTVDWEFLDAKWSTGKKQIEYHNAAYLNEEEKVLYFWEFTKEASSGLSFGGVSESTFQSGITLMRKVKSIQYGPDGKAYEYDLDLGQITKIYKQSAKENGWKFKVVLKKENACFPKGYVPPQTSVSEAALVQQPITKASFCTNCGTKMEEGTRFCQQCGAAIAPATSEDPAPAAVPPQIQTSFQPAGRPAAEKNSEPSAAPTGSKGVWIFAAVTTVIYLIFFGFGKVTPIGWILGIVFIGLAVFFHKRLAAKGYIAVIGLWLSTIVLLFFVFAFTSPSDSNPSGDAVNATSNKSADIADKSGAVNKTSSVLYGMGYDFSKGTSESAIYKVDAGKGKTAELLKSQEAMGYVKYHKNWVYFIKNNAVCRMKTDGSSLKQLTGGDTYVTSFEVGDPGIIYKWDNSNASDNIFAKVAVMNLDGSGSRIVYDGIPDRLWAASDSFYFITMEAKDNRSIFRIPGNGQSAVKYETGAAGSLWIDGDYIYYSNMDDGYKLYRIRKDGSGKEKVLDLALKYDYYFQMPPFQISQGYLIYLNPQPDKNTELLRVKLDGSDQKIMTDDKVSFFRVTGSQVIYSAASGVRAINLNDLTKTDYSNKTLADFCIEK